MVPGVAAERQLPGGTTCRSVVVNRPEQLPFELCAVAVADADGGAAPVAGEAQVPRDPRVAGARLVAVPLTLDGMPVPRRGERLLLQPDVGVEGPVRAAPAPHDPPALEEQVRDAIGRGVDLQLDPAAALDRARIGHVVALSAQHRRARRGGDGGRGRGRDKRGQDDVGDRAASWRRP